eukprot:scaffold614_cov57-Phaeocystis_antarctica.AAC.1
MAAYALLKLGGASTGRDAHAENVGYIGVVWARVPSVVGLSVVRKCPILHDTSSVTNMGQMFNVRPSPSPAPNLQSSPPLHAACSAVARRLPPPRPHLATHRMPSVRLPAVRAGVQPTAELRHLQRH